MPVQDATHRVFRGSSANDSGYDGLATIRGGEASDSNTFWHIGFRAVLYVK